MVKQKTPKILYPPIHNFSTAMGYFDGASSNVDCGCGMILMLNMDHLFRLWMGGGKGSNTRAKLLIL